MHDERFEPSARRAFGVQTVVLARSRCRFKWFRLSAVPAPERLEALRVQARAWQPFDDSAYLLSLRGDLGLVMAWDRLSAQRDLVAAGRDPRRCRLLPESLLRQAAADGAHLVPCISGFEGQVWREGWLCASRWWSVLPNGQDWRLFLHASAAPGNEPIQAEPPAPLNLARTDKPCLAVQFLDGSGVQVRGLEGRVMALSGLALVVGAAAISHQVWELHQSIERSEAAITSLRQSASVVLASRDLALTKAAQAQQVSAWLIEIQPIEVLEHLHEVIGKSGAQIKEMDLAGGKLRLGLQLSPQATRAGVVKDLQSGGWFKSVAEVRGDASRGLVVMDMIIDGTTPPRRRSLSTLAAAARPVASSPPTSSFEAGAAPAVKAGVGVPAATAGPRTGVSTPTDSEFEAGAAAAFKAGAGR